MIVEQECIEEEMWTIIKGKSPLSYFPDTVLMDDTEWWMK